MLRYAKFPSARRYRVEVSGWDAAENFFVENCDLLWTEESGKVISLRHNLSRTAILFVRLLDSEQNDRAHPVVYQASHLEATPDGAQRFLLEALVPRVNSEQNSVV